MNASTPSLKDALAHADLLFDSAELETVIADMGRRIDAALDGERAVFLTVMHGALIFAGQLAPRIRTDLEFDYVHATRYRGATSGSELHWLREPQVSLQGRTVLLVDDILDEGHTFRGLIDECREHGAASVHTAVLADKPNAARVPGLAADYVGLTVPERYVFGSGMDYKGYLRNVDAIYAAHPEDED